MLLGGQSLVSSWGDASVNEHRLERSSFIEPSTYRMTRRRHVGGIGCRHQEHCCKLANTSGTPFEVCNTKRWHMPILQAQRLYARRRVNVPRAASSTTVGELGGVRITFDGRPAFLECARGGVIAHLPHCMFFYRREAVRSDHVLPVCLSA